MHGKRRRSSKIDLVLDNPFLANIPSSILHTADSNLTILDLDLVHGCRLLRAAQSRSSPGPAGVSTRSSHVPKMRSQMRVAFDSLRQGR